MTPEKPVAYRTLGGDWLCPSCWWDCNAPATPFYLENISSGELPICRDCEGLILPEATTPKPCVFCDIVAGRVPTEWILQPDTWPDAVAFVPLSPVAEGHCLIVPKVHVQDFAQDPEVTAVVTKRAAELMQFTPRPMVMMSLRGKEAGQEIMHFHVHLIPRSEGDGLRIVSRREKAKKA